MQFQPGEILIRTFALGATPLCVDLINKNSQYLLLFDLRLPPSLSLHLIQVIPTSYLGRPLAGLFPGVTPRDGIRRPNTVLAALAISIVVIQVIGFVAGRADTHQESGYRIAPNVVTSACWLEEVYTPFCQFRFHLTPPLPQIGGPNRHKTPTKLSPKKY